MNLQTTYSFLSSSTGFGLLFTFAVCFITILYDDENPCQMTYMYQYPQFVEVDIPLEISSRYERYALYAYAEGKQFTKIQAYNFTGIPVLFIPGHSGSYRQVRSLASVSLRKMANVYSFFHFDYFSVDLNGEYSALYGGFLFEQTNYVAHCIKRVLSFYNKEQSSVILIGHSMGGVIARGLFTLEMFDQNEVKLIITLATPHNPVVLTDVYMDTYYKDVNEYWENQAFLNNSNDRNLTLISIGGGYRDLQVRPGLFYTKFADINVVTTAIPGVGVSVDHLCILWCKSLIEVLVRMLHDSVDIMVRGLITDKSELLKVFRYHLITHTDSKHYITHPKIFQTLENSIQIEMTTLRDSLIMTDGMQVHTNLMIKLFDDSKYENIFVLAKNVQLKDWIGICKADISEETGKPYCKSAINLSGKGFTGFEKKFWIKYINLYVRKWIERNMTHIIVQLPASEDSISASFDIYKKSDRTITKTDVLLKERTIIEKTIPNALFYHVQLPTYPLFRVQYAKLNPLTRLNAENQAVVHFNVPWSHEDSHMLVKSNNTRPLNFFMQVHKPEDTNGQRPGLYLYLDPHHVYSLHIGPSWFDTAILLTTRYSTSLICNIIVMLLLCLQKQYRKMSYTGKFPSFEKALVIGIDSIVMHCFLRFISLISSSILFPTYKYNLDMDVLYSDGGYNTVILFMLHIAAYFIVQAFRVTLEILVVTSTKLIRKLDASKILQVFAEKPKIFSGLKIPFDVTPLILYYVYCRTCTGVFFFGGLIYYFLKLCILQENCWAAKEYSQNTCKNETNAFNKRVLFSSDRKCEDDLISEKGLFSIASNKKCHHYKQSAHPSSSETECIHRLHDIEGAYNLHTVLFALWCVFSVMSLPITITWLCNMRSSMVLQTDLANKCLISAVILAAVVWPIDKICNKSGNIFLVISHTLFILSLVAMSYTQIAIYRVILLVNSFLAVIGTFHVLHDYKQIHE